MSNTSKVSFSVILIPLNVIQLKVDIIVYKNFKIIFVR